MANIIIINRKGTQEKIHTSVGDIWFDDGKWKLQGRKGIGTFSTKTAAKKMKKAFDL